MALPAGCPPLILWPLSSEGDAAPGGDDAGLPAQTGGNSAGRLAEGSSLDDAHARVDDELSADAPAPEDVAALLARVEHAAAAADASAGSLGEAVSQAQVLGERAAAARAQEDPHARQLAMLASQLQQLRTQLEQQEAKQAELRQQVWGCGSNSGVRWSMGVCKHVWSSRRQSRRSCISRCGGAVWEHGCGNVEHGCANKCGAAGDEAGGVASAAEEVLVVALVDRKASGVGRMGPGRQVCSGVVADNEAGAGFEHTCAISSTVKEDERVAGRRPDRTSGLGSLTTRASGSAP
eukprot:181602-Chlamydomonas_euryale.AAC.1